MGAVEDLNSEYSAPVGEKKNFVRTFLEGYPKWKEAVFLTSVAGMSVVFGFGASVSRRKEEAFSDKGFSAPSHSHKLESGTALATRALKWGTFYAFTGVGLICFTIWKLMGVNDLKEFRLKAGEFLPRIPKNEPKGRTEFANLTDLLQYVIDEDNRAKAEKMKVVPTIDFGNVDDSQPVSSPSGDGNVSNCQR
ncbi:transmembrane protein 242 isoform X2 [Folsomia candida]|uniref:transmembrane protein 242 isoform X2 n=1 Tax=Folsomia candida TaxID=158441 RepID=UPI000B903EA0|nr:transmembrane protein 242 isoform X2 [Folsomia candida]